MTMAAPHCTCDNPHGFPRLRPCPVHGTMGKIRHPFEPQTEGREGQAVELLRKLCNDLDVFAWNESVRDGHSHAAAKDFLAAQEGRGGDDGRLIPGNRPPLEPQQVDEELVARAISASRLNAAADASGSVTDDAAPSPIRGADGWRSIENFHQLPSDVWVAVIDTDEDDVILSAAVIPPNDESFKWTAWTHWRILPEPPSAADETEPTEALSRPGAVSAHKNTLTPSNTFQGDKSV